MAQTTKNSVGNITGYFFRYSMFFGMCNLFYDFEKHRLLHCPYTVTYCIIVNLVLAISLPIMFLQDLGFSELEMFAKRPLAARVNDGLTTVNTLAIGVSLVSLWTKRGDAQTLFNDLSAVQIHDMEYLKKSDKIERKVRKLIYAKLSSSAIMIAGTFVSFYLQRKDLSLYHAMVAVYITLMENILFILENQFFFGIVYGGYLFKLLNDHLTRIVKDMNNLCKGGPQRFTNQEVRRLYYELTKIGRIHTSLHKLINGVKNLYQFQILIILVTVFATQVSVLFYFSILITGRSLDILGSEFLTATGGVIMSIVDLWLVIYACSDVVKACNAPGDILKMLCSHHVFNKRLSKSIEILSLQLVREKLRLTICGMFDLDGTTGFVIIKASVMNLILLVQLDYTNF